MQSRLPDRVHIAIDSVVNGWLKSLLEAVIRQQGALA